jgi:hypothetical protein
MQPCECIPGPTVVPEPATFALVAIGLLLLAVLHKRRRRVGLGLLAVLTFARPAEAQCPCPPIVPTTPELPAPVADTTGSRNRVPWWPFLAPFLVLPFIGGDDDDAEIGAGEGTSSPPAAPAAPLSFSDFHERTVAGSEPELTPSARVFRQQMHAVPSPTAPSDVHERPTERMGVVPPKTATVLPFALMLGLALSSAGLALLRRKKA